MAVAVWIKDAHSVKLELPQGYGSKPLVTALNVLWKEMHTCSDLGEQDLTNYHKNKDMGLDRSCKCTPHQSVQKLCI